LYVCDINIWQPKHLETKFKIYPIKKGDTLLNVSARLGIDPQEIRSFHNRYCPVPDLIEKDFPSGLKKLIISENQPKVVHAPGVILPTAAFEKYKIKPGDTVKSIASFFNTTTQYLIRFHNIYTRGRECLTSLDIPENLEFLYVDPTFEEKVNNNKIRTKLGPAQKLLFEPDKKNKTYTVLYVFGEDEEKTTLSFQVNTQFLGKYKDSFVYGVNRKPACFVNEEQASSFSDELALKTVQALYPLHIRVDVTGKWQEVMNLNDIRRKWKDYKAPLLDYYEGEWIDAYLQEMEKTITSPTLLQLALEQDLFLNTFFSGIHINYYDKFKAPKDDFIPLIPHCKPVKYSGEIEVQKYVNELDTVDIIFQGTLTDTRGIADFENNNDYAVYNEGGTPAEGSIYAKYILNKDNGIEGIYKKCTLGLSRKQSVEIVISRST
jgi:hypothetical protein